MDHLKNMFENLCIHCLLNIYYILALPIYLGYIYELKQQPSSTFSTSSTNKVNQLNQTRK